MISRVILGMAAIMVAALAEQAVLAQVGETRGLGGGGIGGNAGSLGTGTAGGLGTGNISGIGNNNLGNPGNGKGGMGVNNTGGLGQGGVGSINQPDGNNAFGMGAQSGVVEPWSRPRTAERTPRWVPQSPYSNFPQNSGVEGTLGWGNGVSNGRGYSDYGYQYQNGLGTSSNVWGNDQWYDNWNYEQDLGSDRVGSVGTPQSSSLSGQNNQNWERGTTQDLNTGIQGQTPWSAGQE